jgi:anti-sigma-K factor RskA
LLEGDELAEAEALARSDPQFAREAGRCAGRRSPLLEEVAEATPPSGTWERIAARIEPISPPRDANNVVVLKRRVTLWRAYAGVATALAASLAWLLVTSAPPVPQPALPQTAPMVATMAAPGSPAKLVATWSPAERILVVAAAVAPAAAPGHAHELWMIPAGGRPHAMGMMPREGAMRATLPVELAAQLREGVTLALSVEPEGGSPTGLPTGAVVAAGPLVRT